MPEISRFYGIVIKMFHNDHHPPHFHAEHGGDQDEFRHVWEQARNQEPLDHVDPLP